MERISPATNQKQDMLRKYKDSLPGQNIEKEKDFKHIFDKEIRKMSEQTKIVGADIPRASRGITQYLIDKGILFIGEDNQIHARENASIQLKSKDNKQETK